MNTTSSENTSTQCTTQCSTATPGYIIFLIDQSGSMCEPFSEKNSRAQYAAKVINDVIYKLFLPNTSGSTIKDRIYLSIIGYGGNGGNSLEELNNGYLSTFAENPLRREKFEREIINRKGVSIIRKIERPIFIEPKAKGNSPIYYALELVKQKIEKWVKTNPNCPAPIVINITDGVPFTGETTKEKEINITVKTAHEIMQLSTKDGSPLLYRVHIEKEEGEIKFPSSISELQGNEMAEFLFKISSHDTQASTVVDAPCVVRELSAAYFKANSGC
jgi:hypothetical protein